jgi:hypothetical protein
MGDFTLIKSEALDLFLRKSDFILFIIINHPILSLDFTALFVAFFGQLCFVGIFFFELKFLDFELNSVIFFEKT